MRRTYVIALTTLALLSLSSHASKKKQSPARFTEASEVCRDYIASTAKDPTSIKFEGDDEYDIGHVFTKNDIFVYLKVWGKNTYGATLLHNLTCVAHCKPDNPCSIVYTQETAQ